MSRNPTPRRHHHLRRESIARAALELIDREGLASLSMHRLAADLHVRATNLYPYVADKEGLLHDVLELLLAEVDLSERPGVGWEDCVIAVGVSLREMALRHPHAFPLVGLASYYDPALVGYSRRVERLFVSAGLAEELLPRLVTMLDPYATGYLLVATQVLAKSSDGCKDAFGPDQDRLERAAGLTGELQEYVEGTLAIIAGFKIRSGIGDSPS
jgi:AcrR family transcriptional regulator